MNAGRGLRVVTPPRAFITRAPEPRHTALDAGGPSLEHRADDLAPARALLVWSVLGLVFWIGVIYAVRLILR